MKNMFLWVALALLFPIAAAAEIHVFDSLEWQGLTAARLWTGKVTEVKPIEAPAPQYGVKWIYEEVTLDGHDMEAGSQNGKLAFTWRTTDKSSASRWKDSGHEMLFFLSEDTAKGDDILLRIKGNTLIHGDLDAIDLETGSTAYWPVVSSSKKLLKDKQSILGALSKILQRRKTEKPDSHVSQKEELSPTADKEAYDKLWSGSAVYILTPEEDF